MVQVHCCSRISISAKFQLVQKGVVVSHPYGQVQVIDVPRMLVKCSYFFNNATTFFYKVISL